MTSPRSCEVFWELKLFCNFCLASGWTGRCAAAAEQPNSNLRGAAVETPLLQNASLGPGHVEHEERGFESSDLFLLKWKKKLHKKILGYDVYLFILVPLVNCSASLQQGNKHLIQIKLRPEVRVQGHQSHLCLLFSQRWFSSPCNGQTVPESFQELVPLPSITAWAMTTFH